MRIHAVIVLALLLPFAVQARKKEPPVLDGAGAAKSVLLCRTTLEELKARLGEPTRDGLLHSSRVVSWITQWEPLARYLAVQVDARGVVTDLYWDIPTEIPWTPTDQCTGR